MASTKKTANKKASSAGSDPKSKAKVQQKMQEVMHEFKEGELQSGKSAAKVKSSKRAIAIALSEARKAGAKIAPPPAKKRAAAKKPLKGRKQGS